MSLGMDYCNCDIGPTQLELESNNWHCPKCELPVECECCYDRPVTQVHINYMVCDMLGCWDMAVDFYFGGEGDR